MRSVFEAAGSPLPPPLLRPLGPLREESKRSSVRFDGASARAHSCDVPSRVTRSSYEGMDEELSEALGGFGRGGAGGGGHNILVAVRTRSLLPQENQAGGRAVVKIIEGQTVILEDPQTTAADDYLRLNKSKERRYNFDIAFDETTENEEVYQGTAFHLISGVLQGFNATVFAYGATSAGKTHTMLGNPREPGMMMLTLLDLFAEVAAQRSERAFEIKCSFLEVYNENVRDLLQPDADYLDIREDPVRGMCVAGISEVGGLESAAEIMSLLHQANRYRTTEATGANVTSSRSHAVLQVVVEQRDRTADIMAQVNLGKLSMIDLAGSERASHTNNKGMRMIEGANINRSLLALGNCITALSSAVAFVPYRDSKMTRLLKDSLGGNCRTIMIANVSPCHLNYEDTHNTLKYANRAKNIKTKAVRNVVQVNYHISKYTDIIKELRTEIADLKARLANAPDAIPGSLDPPCEDLQRPVPAQESSEAVHDQCVKWKAELMGNFEERIRVKRRLIDLAHETKNLMVQKGHAQVEISKWESRKQDKGDGGQDEPTPEAIQDLQAMLKGIKEKMLRAEETTHELERMLVDNQQKAEKLQAELPRRVQNKDMRAFLGLVTRIYEMEVENMDQQEMNDVMAPLLEQKELEAEALRLQIKMRDRLIEDQDQLLLGTTQDLPAKPEGWLEIASKTRPRHLNPALLAAEDDTGLLVSESPRRTSALPSLRQPSTDRSSLGPLPAIAGAIGGGASSSARGSRHSVSSVLPSPATTRPSGVGPLPRIGPVQKRAFSEGPQESNARVVLPPLSPTGRGRFNNRGAPEKGPPSDRSRGAAHPGYPGGSVRGGNGVPVAPVPETATLAPNPAGLSETSEAIVQLLLDVNGKGLGHAPRSPVVPLPPGPGPPVTQMQPRIETWKDGDLDLTKVLLPFVEGHVAPQAADHRPPHPPIPNSGSGPPKSQISPYEAPTRPPGLTNATTPRRSRKNRRANRDKERQHVLGRGELRVEASGIHRSRDDTDSGSDRERNTPRRDAPRANDFAPPPIVPKDPAAERRGLLEKLNRNKMKPPVSHAPKSLS